jgi:trk system potassium uptake protein TrkA
VGCHLVKELASDGHALSVIDSDPERIERVRDRHDVLAVVGKATSREMLNAAGTRGADMFIAVSNVDEVHVLSCAAAHGMGVRRTLARVRNTGFTADEPLVDPLRLGVTRYINPDVTAVDTIEALVDSPGSIDVGDFCGGARAAGRSLRNLRLPRGAVLGAVRRGDEVFVPRADTRLEEGDSVVAFVLPGLRRRLERLFERRGGLHFLAVSVAVLPALGAGGQLASDEFREALPAEGRVVPRLLWVTGALASLLVLVTGARRRWPSGSRARRRWRPRARRWPPP